MPICQKRFGRLLGEQDGKGSRRGIGRAVRLADKRISCEQQLQLLLSVRLIDVLVCLLICVLSLLTSR